MSAISVCFPPEFTERDRIEMTWRGYVGCVQIEVASGARYEVTFYDIVRLAQTMDDLIKQGRPGFAEPGLVILPEVTEEAIQNAAAMLYAEGFFDRLKSIDAQHE